MIQNKNMSEQKVAGHSLLSTFSLEYFHIAPLLLFCASLEAIHVFLLKGVSAPILGIFYGLAISIFLYFTLRSPTPGSGGVRWIRKISISGISSAVLLYASFVFGIYGFNSFFHLFALKEAQVEEAVLKREVERKSQLAQTLEMIQVIESAEKIQGDAKMKAEAKRISGDEMLEVLKKNAKEKVEKEQQRMETETFMELSKKNKEEYLKEAEQLKSGSEVALFVCVGLFFLSVFIGKGLAFHTEAYAGDFERTTIKRVLTIEIKNEKLKDIGGIYINGIYSRHEEGIGQEKNLDRASPSGPASRKIVEKLSDISPRPFFLNSTAKKEKKKIEEVADFLKTNQKAGKFSYDGKAVDFTDGEIASWLEGVIKNRFGVEAKIRAN